MGGGGDRGRNVMDQIVSPQNLYMEALTPSMTVFGHRFYKGKLKVK